MFSQRGEDDVIDGYFGDFVGRYLDIGAYDGVTFSNSRLFADKGWEGVCVEPAAHAFDAMTQNPPPNAVLVNALIGPHIGLLPFGYSRDALSSTSPSHMDRWSTVTTFLPVFVSAITLGYLLFFFPGPYHLISIDTEGSTAEIVSDLVPMLDDLETRCLVYEHDGATVDIPSFTEIHRTEENAICVRL